MSTQGRVEFRAADPGDLDLLVQLRLEYIRADLGEPGPGQEDVIVAQLRSWIPANRGERFFAWLAFVEDGPAGVAMLAVNEFPANPGFPTGRVGTVLNVWTRPEHRGIGVATALMGELLELGRGLELSRLELRASAAARSLYERLGFRPAAADHLSMERPYRQR